MELFASHLLTFVGQGGGGTPSACKASFSLGHGGGGTPSATSVSSDFGQGGGGTLSASKASFSLGHGGGGTPSATTVKECFAKLVWSSVIAASNEHAPNTSTDKVRFMVFFS